VLESSEREKDGGELKTAKERGAKKQHEKTRAIVVVVTVHFCIVCNITLPVSSLCHAFF